jgi:dTDP-4-dehydrorhamnose 3,5-epimerase
MPFDIENTPISGCFLLGPKVHYDERGSFVKTFHADEFKRVGLEAEFKEEYYSVSKKNVLRGMHFHLPPHDHTKLVYCVHGEVLDVMVDLRQDSPTYKKVFSTHLSDANKKVLYIAKGIAHGFYTLSEEAIMIYKTSSVFHAESDAGILWSSIDYLWPTQNPILSDRDKAHPALESFISGF